LRGAAATDLPPPQQLAVQGTQLLKEGVERLAVDVQKLAPLHPGMLSISKAGEMDAVDPQSLVQLASQCREKPAGWMTTANGDLSNVVRVAVETVGHGEKVGELLGAASHHAPPKGMKLPVWVGTASGAHGAAPVQGRRQSGGGLPELPNLVPWHKTTTCLGLSGGLEESMPSGIESPTRSARSAKRARSDATHGWRTPRRRRPLGSLPGLLPPGQSPPTGDASLAELDAASALLDLTTSLIDLPHPPTPRANMEEGLCTSSRNMLRPQTAPQLRCFNCNTTCRLGEMFGDAASKDGALSVWLNGWWELRVEWRDLGSRGAVGPSHGDVCVARYASLLPALVRHRVTCKIACMWYLSIVLLFYIFGYGIYHIILLQRKRVKGYAWWAITSNTTL
jgi:hypothetical protein